jgi:pimeloyl-ACP methyl ester carboxylesterase
MSKKPKVPMLLRIVRWWFPKFEKFAPPLATRLFVQLFFSPLNYGFPEKELEWVKTSKNFSLLVNGKKVQGYSWGDVQHPIVLFVHGWAGRATQFRKFFPVFLKAGFRIIAFDGPAHGKSKGRTTNILEFEEVVEEILKKEGVPQAIIAHSFGGVVSLLGATKGLPITKLINIGSPVIGDLIIKTFLFAVNGTWPTAEKFKAYMFKKYSRSFDEFSAEYFIKNLKTPLNLLLVHDDGDKDVPIAHAERLIKLYPDAQLYKTTGLGHTRILKDEKVIKDCLRFVQSRA